VTKLALDAFGSVVANHTENQSAAGEASAVRILLKLAESSGGNPDVQAVALVAFTRVVASHLANQIAAGEASAVCVLLKLAESSTVSSIAAECLNEMLSGCFFNQRYFYVAISSLKQIPADLESLVTEIREVFDEEGDTHSLLQQLNFQCEDARQATCGPASDGVPTVSTTVTRQFGGTCFMFAAVRSFNRR
jgi:hypothetical protein